MMCRTEAMYQATRLIVCLCRLQTNYVSVLAIGLRLLELRHRPRVLLRRRRVRVQRHGRGGRVGEEPVNLEPDEDNPLE